MKIIDSSYKDPSGFVFWENGQIFRQINAIYKDDFELLINSGLYKKLVDIKALIPHEEVETTQSNSYKTIKPANIPFISYPYEWSFSELKDAALLTLRVQKIAFEHGMSLKDASSFNIQFLNGKPIFIDTLSFEKYIEGEPWVAYKQFCEQFLAPLALATFVDIRTNKLLQNYLGSLPLDLVSMLLPLKAKINPGIFLHIVLHAKSQKKYDQKNVEKSAPKSFNRQAFLGLIESLESLVNNLKWQPKETLWSSYGKTNPSYEDFTLIKKKEIVNQYLNTLRPKTLWDLGANTGIYSRVSASVGTFTVSIDSDPSVVEQNYLEVKRDNEQNILPICIDILNPTPNLGFFNKERDSLFKRPLPETVMALALIHHLAIANNLPLPMLAEFFSAICQKSLVIEFVPKEDKQVQTMLQSREDIFPNYDSKFFEEEFGKYFIVTKKTELPNSSRVIYLMEKLLS